MTKKNHVETISQVKPWSWKVRSSLFISIFGILWLFADPLLSFLNATPFLWAIGIWGYVGLMIVTSTIVVLSEFISRSRELGKITFIEITIIVTESGVRHMVRTPRDMRIDKFIDLFLERIEKPTNQKSALPALHMYKLSLLVERGDTYEQIPSNITFREAGFLGGEICKIQGSIWDEYALYSFAA